MVGVERDGFIDAFFSFEERPAIWMKFTSFMRALSATPSWE